jgi:hypothetical protein
MSDDDPRSASVIRIDCDECAHRATPTCDDCLVTFLCTREDDGAVVIPLDEVRAVRLLQGAGLAPRVRHRPRAGADSMSPWRRSTGT